MSSSSSSQLISRLRQLDAPTPELLDLDAPAPAEPALLAPAADAPEPVPDSRPELEPELGPELGQPPRIAAPLRWAMVASLVWLGVIAGGVIALVQAQSVVTIDATTIAAYAAGIFTPLTAFWLMALAFLRGGVLRSEAERAEVSLDGLLAPVEAARVRARALATDLEAHVARVEAAHHTAADRATALGEAQADQALSLAAAARDVEAARLRVDTQMSTLRELLGALQGVTGRLESILPDAARRITTAGDGAAAHAATLQRAGQQLAECATALRQHSDTLVPQLDTSMARIDAAGAQAAERLTLLEIQANAAALALDTAAEKATVALDGSRAWVGEHIATIEQSVARVESDIVRRLETLALTLGETTAQMDRDLPGLIGGLQAQLTAVDGQMRDQVSSIRSTWERLIADWDGASLSAGVRLIDAMSRARTIAGEAVSTARNATDGIVAATEASLRLSSDKATDSVNAVLRDMRVQTAHIEELAMQAAMHRGAMARALEDQVHQDLGRLSEQLIDRLNAYAVDISRIYSGDVTEQELAHYTRGDRGVFARRFAKGLSAIGASKVHNKIGERIAAEPEFSDMVRRYITGFESLLKLSEQTPEKTALTTTLLTSDLGKMYLALARAAGRFGNAAA